MTEIRSQDLLLTYIELDTPTLPIQAYAGLNTVKITNEENKVVTVNSNTELLRLAEVSSEHNYPRRNYTVDFGYIGIIQESGELQINAPSSNSTLIVKNLSIVTKTDLIIKTTNIKEIAFVNCGFINSNNTNQKVIIANDPTGVLNRIIFVKCGFANLNSNTIFELKNSILIGNTITAPIEINIQNTLYTTSNAPYIIQNCYIDTRQYSINEIIKSNQSVYLKNNIFITKSAKIYKYTGLQYPEYGGLNLIIHDNIIYYTEQPQFPLEIIEIVKNDKTQYIISSGTASIANNIINVNSNYTAEDLENDINTIKHRILPYIVKTENDFNQIPPFIPTTKNLNELVDETTRRSLPQLPPSLSHPDYFRHTLLGEILKEYNKNIQGDIIYNMIVGIQPEVEIDESGIQIANYPSETYVRQGIEYAFGTRIGKMIVPDEKYVLLGVQYDTPNSQFAKTGKFNKDNYSTNIKIKGLEQK